MPLLLLYQLKWERKEWIQIADWKTDHWYFFIFWKTETRIPWWIWRWKVHNNTPLMVFVSLNSVKDWMSVIKYTQGTTSFSLKSLNVIFLWAKTEYMTEKNNWERARLKLPGTSIICNRSNRQVTDCHNENFISNFRPQSSLWYYKHYLDYNVDIYLWTKNILVFQTPNWAVLILLLPYH